MTTAPIDLFFKDLARGFARDMVGMIAPGSNIVEVIAVHGAGLLARTLMAMLKNKTDAEYRDTMDGLGRLDPAAARNLTQAATNSIDLPPEDRAHLDNYVASVPMTVRRAIQRPDDHGVPTTLLSQLPRSESEFLKFLPIKSVQFKAGDRLPGGDYELKVLLGQGGFAEVWKADHIMRTNRPSVAVKYCTDPTLAVSLKREIEVIDRLESGAVPEGIVRLIDTGYNAEVPYLIYEYVAGGDLIAWMATFEGQPIPETEIIRVLGMTADALAFAHAAGVVHRDLKPSNLLVTRDGRIKISDFGIGAVTAIQEAKQTHTTHSGATLLRGAHTPLYFDPILDPTSVDPRVDIYSMGVIAYQLLIDNVARGIGPAWHAELAQRGTSKGLIDVIGKCVDLPDNRYQDATELAAAVRALRDTNQKPLREPPKESRADRETAEQPTPKKPLQQPPSKDKRPKRLAADLNKTHKRAELTDHRNTFLKRVAIGIASISMVVIVALVSYINQSPESDLTQSSQDVYDSKLKLSSNSSSDFSKTLTTSNVETTDLVNSILSSTMVIAAQDLLLKLDYEPGPADGELGARTRRAIREFQDDENLPVDGEVSTSLLQELRLAYDEQTESLDSMNTWSIAPAVNLSGSWYNDSGFLSKISQAGDQIQMQTFNQYGQVGIQSSGTFANGLLRYTWQGGGMSGVATGQLLPDGRHLQISTTIGNVPTQFQLHKDHQPHY